ncbi:MAG: hypothetical protein U9R79_18715 [Armatimonadota bacterium]|nr:hypothetical protein [Armatimonadota bacterium]
MRFIAVFVFLLTAAFRAPAQQGLSIEDFTATPRLHEDGQAWDVLVRFTTSAPAVCRAEFGPDRACGSATEPEAEPLRNHRFDVADVPLGEARFVRVVATAGDEEVASEVVEVAPPEPFPEGDTERIEVPLTIEETAGVFRTEPVTFGIPLPEGALGDPARVNLTDGEALIPVQTRALVRWPDRTIKWLLITGRIALGASETRTLTLALGSDVSPTQSRAANSLRETDALFEVTAGGTDTRLQIYRAHGTGMISRPEGINCPLPVSRLTAADGTVFTGRVESVEIEEHGPQRTVILARGHHVNEQNEPHFGFELRYFVRAGDPLVRIDHVLQHDIVSADMEYGDEMKSFRSLDLVFQTMGESAAVVLEDGQSAQIAPGERLFQYEDNAYELPDAEGTRAAGLATMSGLAVAVRDFWQNWPKSLEAQDGALAVGLYPRITPQDRYADRPDEHILYYYLRDGSYTFRAGFEKRHELLIGPAEAASTEQMLARVQQPLVVTAAPEWYTSSGALHNIAAAEGEFEAYNDILSDAIDGFVEVREREHWYGLMNFGDWYGERGNNWGNIEYDLQQALFTQYFRTGDRRFFEVAEDAARHNADVDIVHHAAGQKAGPGGPRRVGPAWVHCMGHTGGYYPYDYMDMSIYAQGYCENEGHMWNQGNLQYWLLTGDEQVHRAAMQLADWVAGPDTVDFGYGNARVPGWMGIIAMSTYFATYDEYYLNAMRLIYEEVQEKADPEAGLWVHKLGGGHCRCEEKHYGEAGFMAGVLMTALKYFYIATGDEEVAQRIVKIANWLVESLYEPRQGNFRYTSCPKTSISTTSPLIMGNGLGFAANYSGDERLMEITRNCFVRALVAFAGGAHGKTIGYGTCLAPMAIYEISRFPGPSLDEMIEALLAAARDPGRRPLPCIVPNPDLERGTEGWRVRSGLGLSHTSEVTHTGNGAAMASGTIEGQNEYFVTHYACGPPWEIMSLAPGETYRLQLWLRVDEIGEEAPPPTARVSVRSRGVTQRSFPTNEYDLSRMKTWQLLQTEFTVPEGTDAAYIAVNTETHEPQDVLMYLDDVAIVPADTAPRDTYAWPAVELTGAQLSGGARVEEEDILDGWQAVAAPNEAGSATVSIEVPFADTWRLLARAKSQEAEVSLPVRIDGEEVGALAVEPHQGWAWAPLMAGGEQAAVELQGGAHQMTVELPGGTDVMLQKVALSNAFAP